MTDCPDCTDDQHLCFKHKLNFWRTEGTLYLDPKATPTRSRSAAEPAKANPVWERQVVTERRPGGTEMPMLDKNFNPIRVKNYSENRTEYEAARRRLADTTPLAT